MPVTFPRSGAEAAGARCRACPPAHAKAWTPIVFSWSRDWPHPRCLRWPPSIVLPIGGGALAFVPGIPSVRLDPDLVLVLFQPPLLMDGAWNTALAPHYDVIIAAVEAGRTELVRLHRAHQIDNEILESLERDLDLEELGAISAKG